MKIAASLQRLSAGLPRREAEHQGESENESFHVGMRNDNARRVATCRVETAKGKGPFKSLALCLQLHAERQYRFRSPRYTAALHPG